MLAVKTEDVPSQRSHFGLDTGLANLAVLSGPSVIKFFNGKPLRSGTFATGKHCSVSERPAW